MPLPTKLDHCVIHVSDWERSNAFYRDVLGAELVTREAGWAYRFGDKQLNVHGVGVRPAEVARLPVQPGNSDLCFEWMGPIEDAIAHLEAPQHRGRGRADAALRRQGQRHQRLFPRSRRLADGIHVVPALRRTMAEAVHNPLILPDNLPVPQDDGAARHLHGMRLPDIVLAATDGTAVNLSKLTGRNVVYVYPRTGRPGQASADRLGRHSRRARLHAAVLLFRDHFAELKRLGVAQLYGLSTQDTAYQREAVERLHLPFPILSDASLHAHPRAEPADLRRRRHDAASSAWPG